MLIMGDAKAGHFRMASRSAHRLDGKGPGVSRVVEGQLVCLGPKNDHVVIEPAGGKDLVLGGRVNL